MGDDGVESVSRRRVYDLPVELVDRVVDFQKERALPSEVEAVRRLLDQALKSRDTIESVVVRYLSALHDSDSAEAAKLVLVGHPLVTQLTFSNEEVSSFRYEKDKGDKASISPLSWKSVRIVFDDDASEYGSTYEFHPAEERGRRLLDSNGFPPEPGIPF